MEWGTAMHLAIAEYHRGNPQSVATKRALDYFTAKRQAGMFIKDDSPRQEPMLMLAIDQYYREYNYDEFTPLQLQGSDELAIECPFELPYKHYEEHDLLVTLCGVRDAVGYYNNRPIIKDIKTTSAYNKKSYFNSYNTSLQMLYYSWICVLEGTFPHYPGIIIDGVFIKKSGIELARSHIIEPQPHLMEAIQRWVHNKIDTIVNTYVKYGEYSEHWTYNFTRCEEKFGKCEFQQACELHPSYQTEYLNRNYDIKEYNPANFNSVRG